MNIALLLDYVNPTFLYKIGENLDNFVDQELGYMEYLVGNFLDFFPSVNNESLEDFFYDVKHELHNTWNEVANLNGEDVVTVFFRFIEAFLLAYLSLARNLVFFSSDATLAFAEFVHLVGTHLKSKYAKAFDMIASRIAFAGKELKTSGIEIKLAMMELDREMDDYLGQYAAIYGENLSKYFGFHCIYSLLAEAALALSIAYATAEDIVTFWFDSLKLFAMFYGLERLILYISDIVSDKLDEIKEDNKKFNKFVNHLTDDLPSAF